MSAPLSLHAFMTPANRQGVNVAAVTVPDIETTLLAEEQQAQQDDDNLVKVLKECKLDNL